MEQFDAIASTLPRDPTSMSAAIINPYKSAIGVGAYRLPVLEKVIEQEGYAIRWSDKEKSLGSIQFHLLFACIINRPSNSKLGIRHWHGIRPFGSERVWYDLDSKKIAAERIGGKEQVIEFLSKQLDGGDSRLFLVTQESITFKDIYSAKKSQAPAVAIASATATNNRSRTTSSDRPPTPSELAHRLESLSTENALTFASPSITDQAQEKAEEEEHIRQRNGTGAAAMATLGGVVHTAETVIVTVGAEANSHQPPMLLRALKRMPYTRKRKPKHCLKKFAGKLSAADARHDEKTEKIEGEEEASRSANPGTTLVVETEDSGAAAVMTSSHPVTDTSQTCVARFDRLCFDQGPQSQAKPACQAKSNRAYQSRSGVEPQQEQLERRQQSDQPQCVSCPIQEPDQPQEQEQQLVKAGYSVEMSETKDEKTSSDKLAVAIDSVVSLVDEPRLEEKNPPWPAATATARENELEVESSNSNSRECGVAQADQVLKLASVTETEITETNKKKGRRIGISASHQAAAEEQLASTERDAGNVGQNLEIVATHSSFSFSSFSSDSILRLYVLLILLLNLSLSVSLSLTASGGQVGRFT